MADYEQSSDVQALMHQIADLIVHDEKYRGRVWDSMSLAAIITDTCVDMSGFSYVDGAKPHPGTPRNGEIMDKLRQLRAMTQRDGELAWKAVLVQIRKATKSIQIWFEYDDANRWKVTPQNLPIMRETLRPE